MISKEEAISQFRQIIGQKSSWLKLMTSQFMEHLSIFVSWCLREALWRLERLNQEFFLSTALNRSSIMAHVEDREYLPRKRTPSDGTARITNNGTVVVSLPVHTPFLSDKQLDYLTTAAITIQPGEYADVPISQMSLESISFTISQEKSFYEYLLSKEQTSGLTAFDVYLDTDGNGYVLWEKRRLFRNSTATDTVYDEFYSHTEQTGIRFGNGTFGAIPPLNTKVKIDLWLTEGETTLLSGQQLSIVGEHLDNAGEVVDVEVITQSIIDGGGSEESLEEIRNNLHYWPIYLDKLIWEDDYEFFIRKSIANVIWVKAWGEAEQEAVSGYDEHNINKIFISAYVPGNTSLSSEVITLFSGIRLLNRSFQWVDPVFSSFTLSIAGKVGRTVVVAEAKQAINNVLSANYGKDSSSRKKTVFIKDLYQLVNDTGYFAAAGSHFEITIAGTMQATQLQEMISIDMSTTTIALSYV